MNCSVYRTKPWSKGAVTKSWTLHNQKESNDSSPHLTRKTTRLKGGGDVLLDSGVVVL